MITMEHFNRLADSRADVMDSEGKKIGTLGELYLDDHTEQPSWATVNTGLFGMSEFFVPLREATADGQDIRVPYTKDRVKDAPRIEPGSHMSESEEDRLYEYYGLGTNAYGTAGTGTTGTGISGTGARDADRAVSGTSADADTAGRGTAGRDRDDAMTRSEERLRVGTESQETGRARLRKYVVTENVTRTVPVTHEEVRVEREPITDANRDEALAGPDISEAEHEVTLHEERPVVEKETVPVERVRLEKDTVTDQETVDEDVRKERIETDGDTGTGRI
ncbi:hypothetical protein D477_000075 [Arthrobacter crystallopoietes BAB-32]|uniref:PRC-barrel domain-containing protein n=1 Tax=Arthrobacter crystallopoietes BAB-32 TaxID=1246476 RepID=N1V828_9MICC|nr:PRC and DUF2382 domain-containing protein [Arthrobacter crystallopoietes]EMY36257.1 hypothetical protein D477_000075 [Arthrobacter crystallopoietes BAB-32]